MADSTCPLSVRGLTKVFPSKPPFTAVDGISFELGQGEILGLLGPNGAGKTTTIRMLISVLAPSNGNIKYFGRDLSRQRSEILQDVAFASTYTHLPLFLTIAENLDVHGRLYGMKSAERKRRSTELLSFFGIAQLEKLRVNQLSAGQRTRLMLVKAFLPRPRVLLLDEPTASLDPDMAEEVRSFVARQRREEGISILFTSHNMAEVSTLCDRVIFLKSGKIVAIDTPGRLASSVGDTRLELSIDDGLKSAAAILERLGISFEVSEQEIHALLCEKDISKLLLEMARANVNFSRIHIHAPSLEDYFLKVAR